MSNPAHQPLVPPQPKPPKRKRFGFLALGVTALVAALIGGAIGGASGSGTTAAPAPTVTVTAEGSENQPVEEEPAEAAGATIGEGTHEVGVDVEPGRYKSTVPEDSILCTYQRLKNDTGDAGAILDVQVAQPGAAVSVTIKDSDGFFETSGCGEWVKR